MALKAVVFTIVEDDTSAISINMSNKILAIEIQLMALPYSISFFIIFFLKKLSIFLKSSVILFNFSTCFKNLSF